MNHLSTVLRRRLVPSLRPNNLVSRLSAYVDPQVSIEALSLAQIGNHSKPRVTATDNADSQSTIALIDNGDTILPPTRPFLVKSGKRMRFEPLPVESLIVSTDNADLDQSTDTAHHRHNKRSRHENDDSTSKLDTLSRLIIPPSPLTAAKRCDDKDETSVSDNTFDDAASPKQVHVVSDDSGDSESDEETPPHLRIAKRTNTCNVRKRDQRKRDACVSPVAKRRRMISTRVTTVSQEPVRTCLESLLSWGSTTNLALAKQYLDMVQKGWSNLFVQSTADCSFLKILEHKQAMAGGPPFDDKA